MADYTKIVDRAGDSAVSALKQAEDVVVSALSQASDFVGGMLPEIPELPMSDAIPAPKALVETTFGLIEKLLDAQKEYTLALVNALDPITSKVLPASKPRKTTKKAAAA
jgi:hypothetical protein